MSELKHKIELKRKKNSQKELAKRLKISPQFLSQIINGKRACPKKYESKIQKFLNE